MLKRFLRFLGAPQARIQPSALPLISLPILGACVTLSTASSCQAQIRSAEATLYSTMPSTTAHRPEMAFDGDSNSFFKSVYGMSGGDDFTIQLSRLLPLRSLRVTTGTAEGDDLLTQGFVEVSLDGATYKRVATFDEQGIANATITSPLVGWIRIKLNPNTSIPSLVLREITLDSPTPISYVSWGAGRPFSDYSSAPDLKEWAAKADRQMKESWADTAALLYSDGFITPNKINVIYRSGPDVTPVAAAGGGVITVNVAWARVHPEDTGLTVHEVAHVIQAMSAYDPVWLIEGIADYVRWVKFEPQNFRVQINPDKAKYSDSYRTTGAFLAWCELKYDSRLVSKLNRDTRLGTFKIDNFKRYTGKDIDTLWSEFLVAYKTDPIGIIATPTALADKPRPLPVVAPNTSVAVGLSKDFNALGITKDGATFDAQSGFDGGGATFSADALGTSVAAKGVTFPLGEAGKTNIVTAQGQSLILPKRNFASLWVLGAAINGNQREQSFSVTYSDGTKQLFEQHLSDWFSPQSFPGESRAARTTYRNTSGGAKDPRTFSLYCYGFSLDPNKTVVSLTLPNNPNIRIAGVSLAD